MTSGPIPSIRVADLPSELGDDVLLLDVREPDEWAQGHAPNAMHIPLADVPARMGEIDLDAQLYVICRQGGRSRQVVAYLNDYGYEATNIADGMVAWQSAGRPIVGEGDQPGWIY